MRTIHRNPFEISVTFTNGELAAIRKTAEKRQAPKDANPALVTDKRYLKRDNVETHMIGLLGEFALAKLIHQDIDSDSYLNGDTIKDFVLHGVSIEVKTLQGYLTFKQLSDFVADVAVLVIYNKADFSDVSVQGWISRHDFRELHFTDNFGYGDRPCVQPAILAPIVTLKSYCVMTRNFRWLLIKAMARQQAIL